jgi:hypothetical protein
MGILKICRSRPLPAAVLAFALILVSLPADAYAGDRGMLEGIVMTDQGTPLLGAVVSLVNRFLPGIKTYAVSDRQGHFYFDALKPGEYTLSASAQGFVNLKVKGIRIFGGQRLSAALDLESLAPGEGRREIVVDSLDDLKWYLRSASRHVLNREDGTMLGREQKTTSSSRFNIFDSGLNGRIEMVASAAAGDTSQAAVGPVRNSTKVDLAGGIGRSANWDLSARLMSYSSPSYAAQGRVNCDVIDNHSLQMQAEYYARTNQGAFPSDGLKENGPDMRSGSVYAVDSWQVFNPLVLACGVRFNHYSYLDRSDYLSPKVEVWYTPAKNTSISGSVSYEADALNNEDIFFYGAVDSAPGTRSLEAERGFHYAVTLEQRFKGTSMVRVTAFYQEATDRIAHYYRGLAESAVPGEDRFLVFNLGDTETRGLNLELSRRLTPYLRGAVGYQIRQASFADGNELITGHHSSNTIMPIHHTMQDITATAETEIARTATTVAAIVRMNTGYPVMDKTTDQLAFSRTVDIKLRQKLPGLSLQNSEIQAILEVANLLNDTFPQVVTFNGDRTIGLPRRITGGFSLIF